MDELTKFHREYRLCPQCANEQEQLIWDIVDVTADPDLKERLLKKDLQRFVCHNCGEESILAERMIYLDREARLLILYLPELASGGDLDPEKFLEQAGWLKLAQELGALDQNRRAAAGWSLRLVYSYSDLIEKIVLFDQKLDDRLMELLKLALSTRYKQEEHMDLEELYFLDLDKGALLFQVLVAERGWQVLELPESFYSNASSKLELPLLSAAWPCVDQSWARSYVEAATAAGTASRDQEV